MGEYGGEIVFLCRHQQVVPNRASNEGNKGF